MRYLFIIVMLLHIDGAYACSCDEVSIEKKFNNSDYVYQGQIVAGLLLPNGDVENTLNPIDVYKGKPEQWKMISESGEFNMCSIYAAVGMKYIVFGLNGVTPKLTLCSYSTTINSSRVSTLEALRGSAANKQFNKDIPPRRIFCANSHKKHTATACLLTKR